MVIEVQESLTTINDSDNIQEWASIGDAIQVTKHDTRWWKRLLHWATFQKPPTIIEGFKITIVESSSIYKETKQ